MCASMREYAADAKVANISAKTSRHKKLQFALPCHALALRNLIDVKREFCGRVHSSRCISTAKN